AVGTMVTQLACEFGAYVIGTGRAADRQKALDFGAHEFVDLDNDVLEDVGRVDLVFDVIGGDIQKRSAALIRPGGTLVSIVGSSIKKQRMPMFSTDSGWPITIQLPIAAPPLMSSGRGCRPTKSYQDIDGHARDRSTGGVLHHEVLAPCFDQPVIQFCSKAHQ